VQAWRQEQKQDVRRAVWSQVFAQGMLRRWLSQATLRACVMHVSPDAQNVRAILAHLGEPTGPPRIALARRRRRPTRAR